MDVSVTDYRRLQSLYHILYQSKRVRGGKLALVYRMER